MLWSIITYKKGHTRTNKYIYNCILQHPQVVQSPISNNPLKVSIDGHSEPKLVSKLLLQVSVQELHNIMETPQEEGGIKDTIDAYNNIIISDSALR